MEGFAIIPGSERAYATTSDGAPGAGAPVAAASADDEEREKARLRRIVAKGREAERTGIEDATEEALLRQLRAWRRGA